MPSPAAGAFQDADRAYRAAVDALIDCKRSFGDSVHLTKSERDHLARLKGAVRAAKARMDKTWQAWEDERLTVPGSSSRAPEGHRSRPHRDLAPKPPTFERHRSLTGALLGDPQPGRTPWS